MLLEWRADIEAMTSPSNSFDRLSDLPDSVLVIVLSFLPTKEAVATTILSKRWDHLWTKTDNLYLYCPNLGGDTDNRFADFVEYVLRLHNPGDLNRFSLQWAAESILNEFSTWTAAAIARNVREIVINVGIITIDSRFLTPIFSCQSLRSLELNFYFWFYHDIGVSLPRLERLTLKRALYADEEVFCKLLHGCPMLKYLAIHLLLLDMFQFFDHDEGKIAFTFKISSPTLQHLELCLDHCGLCGVQLDAPSLHDIRLIDAPSSYKSCFLHKGIVFLGEASNFQLTSFKHKLEDCDHFVEAFHVFSCAKTLFLSDFVMRNLSCAKIKMTTRFNLLTRLEVLMNWRYCSSLFDLIELSDNLEVLIVHKEDDVIGRESRDHLTNAKWKTPNTVPTCLSKSLRTVSISDYFGHQNALAMVKYILEHGSILQVMKIRIDFKTKFEMKASKFAKRSRDCEVVFC